MMHNDTHVAEFEMELPKATDWGSNCYSHNKKEGRDEGAQQSSVAGCGQLVALKFELGRGHCTPSLEVWLAR